MILSSCRVLVQSVVLFLLVSVLGFLLDSPPPLITPDFHRRLYGVSSTECCVCLVTYISHMSSSNAYIMKIISQLYYNILGNDKYTLDRKLIWDRL